VIATGFVVLRLFIPYAPSQVLTTKDTKVSRRPD
jgi:hypothetical protein